MTDDIKKKLTKGAVTGTILAVAASTIYGGGAIDVYNVAIPSAVPLFVSGAGASILSDYMHDKMYPNLSTVEQKLSDVAAVAAGAGVSGMATAGILSLTGVPKENLIPAAILGGGSYVAADYIEMKLLQKEGQLIF